MKIHYINHNFYNAENGKRVVFQENNYYDIANGSISEFTEIAYPVLSAKEKRKLPKVQEITIV